MKSALDRRSDAACVAREREEASSKTKQRMPRGAASAADAGATPSKTKVARRHHVVDGERKAHPARGLRARLIWWCAGDEFGVILPRVQAVPRPGPPADGFHFGSILDEPPPEQMARSLL